MGASLIPLLASQCLQPTSLYLCALRVMHVIFPNLELIQNFLEIDRSSRSKTDMKVPHSFNGITPKPNGDNLNISIIY